jgi:hypothetical protein
MVETSGSSIHSESPPRFEGSHRSKPVIESRKVCLKNWLPDGQFGAVL